MWHGYVYVGHKLCGWSLDPRHGIIGLLETIGSCMALQI
jgi:hypothetical protein